MQRVPSVDRGEPILIQVDGREVNAYSGESIATALLLAGVTEFHRTKHDRPRAPMCNMGVCMECLVQVDADGWVRACVTPVREAMQITTGVCFAKRSVLQSGTP